MQDLFQNDVNDLSKMREEFHEELRASATELAKAMGDYSRRGEEALASFMAKLAARGDAPEAAAAARFNRFRGLPADGVVSEEQLRPWQSGLWRTASRTMGTASSGPRSRLSNPDRPLEDPKGSLLKRRWLTLMAAAS